MNLDTDMLLAIVWAGEQSLLLYADFRIQTSILLLWMAWTLFLSVRGRINFKTLKMCTIYTHNKSFMRASMPTQITKQIVHSGPQPNRIKPECIYLATQSSINECPLYLGWLRKLTEGTIIYAGPPCRSEQVKIDRALSRSESKNRLFGWLA